MGYTHYWTNPTSENWTNNFGTFRSDIDHILRKHDWMLENSGFSKEEGLWFDGRGECGYEGFHVGNDNKWTFCKTAHRKYDIVVTSCLLVLSCYIPEMNVSSDGFYLSSGDHEWFPAVRNVERMMYDIKIQMHSEEANQIEKLVVRKKYELFF